MKKYVKSPLNYVGGKYKLLEQIIPLFPKNMDTFVDLFCGGCNIGANVKAKKIICNDTQKDVIQLMNYLKKHSGEEVVNRLLSLISHYGLSNTAEFGYDYYESDSSSGVARYNKTKYIKLRDDFNANRSDPELFFLTLIFAFNNQIRFNKKGEFNMPVNKRDFNKNLKKNTVEFIDKLSSLNIEFSNYSFEDIEIHSNSFVYCDPPYLITTASYNESGGWNDELELKLLNKLDELNSKNIKFALSNVLEHKGRSNDVLKEWSKKYNIHYLNFNYNNSNYQTKNKDKNSSVEVLITNY